MKRELKAGAGATLLIAGALSVALIGGAGSGSAAGTPSSAYGVKSEGLLPLDPTPYVSSTDGKAVTDSLASVPLGPLGEGVGLVEVSAANDAASVQIADVSVAGDLLANLAPILDPIADACTQILAPVDDALPLSDILDPSQLDALTGALTPVTDALESLTGTTGLDAITGDIAIGDLTGICEKLADPIGELLGIDAVTLSCRGTTGTVGVAGLNVIGLPVDVAAAPPANTVIDLSPIAKITINEQTTAADGTFSVTGLKAELLPGTAAAETLTLGNATCGHISNDNPVPPAPAPSPIETDVPVTG